MEEDIEKIERFIILSEKTFGESTELAFAWRRIKDRYRELEERHNKYMNGEIFSAKQVKKFEEERDKYYIHKSKIKEIRDKAEVMDYYVLGDVIEDLNKLLGDEK